MRHLLAEFSLSHNLSLSLSLSLPVELSPHLQELASGSFFWTESCLPCHFWLGPAMNMWRKAELIRFFLLEIWNCNSETASPCLWLEHMDLTVLGRQIPIICLEKHRKQRKLGWSCCKERSRDEKQSHGTLPVPNLHLFLSSSCISTHDLHKIPLYLYNKSPFLA